MQAETTLQFHLMKKSNSIQQGFVFTKTDNRNEHWIQRTDESFHPYMLSDAFAYPCPNINAEINIGNQPLDIIDIAVLSVDKFSSL